MSRVIGTNSRALFALLAAVCPSAYNEQRKSSITDRARTCARRMANSFSSRAILSRYLGWVPHLSPFESWDFHDPVSQTFRMGEQPFRISRVDYPQPQHLFERIEIAIAVQKLIAGQQTERSDPAVNGLADGISALT